MRNDHVLLQYISNAYNKITLRMAREGNADTYERSKSAWIRISLDYPGSGGSTFSSQGGLTLE